MISSFQLCFTVTLLLIGVQGQFRDEPCRLGRRRRGICSYIDECPIIQKQIQRKVYPQICSFEGFDLVICCPRRSTPSPTDPTVAPPIQQTRGKSVQKCEEYTNAAIEISNRPGLHTTVVGGTKASAAEFPHMAALGFGDINDVQWQCGGTLISELFVLTAAHCLFSQDYGQVAHVRLGDFNLKSITDDAQPQNFEVAKVFRHPGYVPPSQYNDIALVMLDHPVHLTVYVQPACLHTDHSFSSSTPIATGWGRLGFIGESSDELMKVSLSFFTNEQCKRVYRNVNQRRLPNGIDDETQLCAGGITGENKDTCQGDSGGPLQLLTSINPYQYYVIGVTSFGKSCGVENTPGVYTRVSHYISWIEEIVWQN